MKIFLTGGTGFVGREILAQLLQSGYSVRALVRNKEALGKQKRLETVIADSTDATSLANLLHGCDAIINLVGIIREFPKQGINFKRLHIEATQNLLWAANQQGVSRFLQMSANGTRADARTGYHKTKWAAEQLVRQSGLAWTIFRPSLIFGPGDQFVNMLAKLIQSLPVIPVMGDGKYRLQPVSVANVAAGFVKGLEIKESIGQTYHCAGPQDFSYNEILDVIGDVLGKSSGVRKLHHPLLVMKPLIALLQSFPQFPMSSDQLQMLLEGNCCDPTHWSETLDLELQGFASGIAEYL